MKGTGWDKAETSSVQEPACRTGPVQAPHVIHTPHEPCLPRSVLAQARCCVQCLCLPCTSSGADLHPPWMHGQASTGSSWGRSRTPGLERGAPPPNLAPMKHPYACCASQAGCTGPRGCCGVLPQSCRVLGRQVLLARDTQRGHNETQPCGQHHVHPLGPVLTKPAGPGQPPHPQPGAHRRARC